MQLPDVFSRYRPFVDERLKVALDRGDLPLYKMLRYHMGWLDEEFRPSAANTGKAVRPALCLFACEAVGGDWRRALPAAASVELVHNFSLVHDDIQDGDTERRHRKTLWYLWGHSHGLNAGDAMNVLANLALAEDAGCNLQPATALQVSRLLTTACAEMIEGQTLDLSYEQRPTVSVGDYLLMIGKKTGALLEASLHIGATIGAQDARTVEGMRRFGKGIGLLFQVRDDVLGVWGKEETTGKPAGSDLRRRKKSLPVVHALQQGRQQSAAQRFGEIYATKDALTEEQVASLLGALNELGTLAFCEGLAEQQARATLTELDSLELRPSARRECEQMVRFLVERDF